MSIPARFHASSCHSMGGTAAEVVENASRLTIAATFSHSFYAEDEHGRLVCFLGRDRESGPLHVLCDGLPEGMDGYLYPGEEAERSDSLLIWRNLTCDLSGACVWKPGKYPVRCAEDIRYGMEMVTRLLPDCAPEHSLLRALVCNQDAADPDAVARALRKEVGAGLAALADCVTNPTPASDAAALSLLGLGPGLTPSGDDILAGALLAMHALGRPDVAARLGCVMLGMLTERTNRISAAHLSAAVRGEGAGVFHEFLAAVLGEGDLPALLRRVARIGHTSGWDALLGIVWVIRTWLQNMPEYIR